MLFASLGSTAEERDMKHIDQVYHQKNRSKINIQPSHDSPPYMYVMFFSYCNSFFFTDL